MTTDFRLLNASRPLVVYLQTGVGRGAAFNNAIVELSREGFDTYRGMFHWYDPVDDPEAQLGLSAEQIIRRKRDEILERYAGHDIIWVAHSMGVPLGFNLFLDEELRQNDIRFVGAVHYNSCLGIRHARTKWPLKVGLGLAVSGKLPKKVIRALPVITRGVAKRSYGERIDLHQWLDRHSSPNNQRLTHRLRLLPHTSVAVFTEIILSGVRNIPAFDFPVINVEANNDQLVFRAPSAIRHAFTQAEYHQIEGGHDMPHDNAELIRAHVERLARLAETGSEE